MNNLQYIIKDDARFAMHVAVELCEQGDFDSVTDAFRWLLQECDDAACEWTLKDEWQNRSGDDYVYGYETSCGARHTWWPDSTPNFCPSCGGRVKAVKR